MKLDKANSRDKKRNKRRNGMCVDGTSVRLLVRIQIRKYGRGEM